MQLWRRGGASIIDFLSTVNETNCVVLVCFACFQIPSALVGAPEDLQEDEGFPEGSLIDVHVLLRGASLSWERCHRLSDHEWWNCFSRWDGLCSSVEKDFRRDFFILFWKVWDKIQEQEVGCEHTSLTTARCKNPPALDNLCVCLFWAALCSVTPAALQTNSPELRFSSLFSRKCFTR